MLDVRFKKMRCGFFMLIALIADPVCGRDEIPEIRIQLEIPIVRTDLNNDGLYERIIYSYYITYSGIGATRYLRETDLDSEKSFWDSYQGGPITILPNDYELIPNRVPVTDSE